MAKPYLPTYQQRGRILPHFQMVRIGAKLEIINEDPVRHNTHAILKHRTLFNLLQPLQDQVIRKALKRPGLVEITCDTHDWMNVILKWLISFEK